jgi:hypothetical protein
MKLHGVVDLHIRGERILRDPNLWDRIKQAFGGEPDLSTERMKASIEATALVDGVRAALSKLGVTNAVSLVIDDQVLFEDREGKADDLGDLFVAFHNAAPVFGQGFRLLRLAAEHVEAGLHVVLETVALTEHPADRAAARIVIAGRVTDYEPRPGEDADAYRRRIEPLVKDATLIETHRRQFESFVSRVANAVRASMPDVRVELREAEARIERPRKQERAPAREEPRPTDHRYDPYDRYYPSPFSGMLSMMMWSSIFSMGMRPDVVVVDDHGDALGHASDIPPDVAADPVGADLDGDGWNDGIADDGGMGDAGGFDGGGFDGGFDFFD